jgi:hypothetical protein
MLSSLLGYSEDGDSSGSLWGRNKEVNAFKVGYEYDPEGMQWFESGPAGFMELLSPTGEQTAKGVVSPPPMHSGISDVKLDMASPDMIHHAGCRQCKSQSHLE